MKSVQNTNERKAELFRKMGIDETGGTAPVDLKTFQVGHLHGEYLGDEGDLLLHFFWREPPPPGTAPIREVGSGLPAQDNYAPWPANFRECMRECVLDMFKLHDEQRRVEIEWIEELASLYVLVKGVTKIITPSEQRLIKLSETILSRIKQ